MPIFFDATLLKELTGSFTLEKIRDRIESLRAEYNNICEVNKPTLPSSRCMRRDDFASHP